MDEKRLADIEAKHGSGSEIVSAILVKSLDETRLAVSDLIEEVKRLRGLIPRTADSVLVPDCEHLYCPKCAEVVRKHPFRIDFQICDTCHPEVEWASLATVPGISCYSTPEAAKLAKEI